MSSRPEELDAIETYILINFIYNTCVDRSHSLIFLFIFYLYVSVVGKIMVIITLRGIIYL